MSEPCSCGSGPRGEWLELPPLDDLKRAILFAPGYRCELPVGSPRGHGRHGMEIWFRVLGQKGEVSFGCTIGQLHPGGDEGRMPGWFHSAGAETYGKGIFYHTIHRQYKDQEPRHEECEVFGGPCYIDSSSLAGGELMQKFALHGDAAIWDGLRSRYHALREPKANDGSYVDLEVTQ